jgi:outer membrane protein assembly factor BamE (lipoprotein component of BamABCDE complex)
VPQGRTDLLFKGGTNMSYTFSRRDFMKYTALTAVAIAGSGMLTGCSNPNRPVGKTGDTLKPGSGICDATLKSATYTGNTLTCNFKIVTKIEFLEITDSHFQVDVTTAEGTKHYYYNTTSKPSLGATANPKAKKDSVTEATLTLNLDLSGATKVAVLYTPKHAATGEPNDSYNDIYGTWDITDAIKDSIPTA